MKSYTDIEQSKKLTKILPLESADYCWGIDDETLHYNSSPYPCAWKDYTCKEYYIPCWSLAALLELIADKNCTWLGTDDVSAWRCIFNLGKGEHYETTEYTTPIDACYEMILTLHELNLL